MPSVIPMLAVAADAASAAAANPVMAANSARAANIAGAAPFSLLEYLPILLFLGVALILSCLFVLFPIAVSRVTGAHKPGVEKLSEYECGFPAFENARKPFDVRFYLVAILFIVFDLEIAFLFPWAVVVFDPGSGPMKCAVVTRVYLVRGEARVRRIAGLSANRATTSTGQIDPRLRWTILGRSAASDGQRRSGATLLSALLASHPDNAPSPPRIS